MRAALAFAILCMVIGALLADGYIGRLSKHAGYFLVPVEDRVEAPVPPRPRLFFVLVDGLRADAAETMAVTRTLEAHGQCRLSNQGSLTVSRPVYSLVSAGLEADRTGARNNDDTSPLAAESIWEVAREAGLRVSGASHLPWWKELFPRGFDRYTLAPSHVVDVFEDRGDLDVNLFHPLYVDEAGHSFGAASVNYRAAVTRADHEIARLLARVDLTNDVVVLTADHGHTASGGHGGAQPEIADVLVCFAGRNVQRRTERGVRGGPPGERAAFDGRATAATLAVLLGLRFPRHMRAGDDGLDVVWDIVAPNDANAAYLADRRAAVTRFRDANARALETWLGGPPGMWPRLYAREARAQDVRLGFVGLAMVALLTIVWRKRRLDARDVVRRIAWLAVACAVTWAVHHAVLGDFDFSVVNERDRFVPRAVAIAFVSTAVALLAHRVLVRSCATLDFASLLGLLLIANLGHVLAYGWPLGFPLPPAPLRYFPFVGGIGLAVAGATMAAVFAVKWKIDDVARRRASFSRRRSS